MTINYAIMVEAQKTLEGHRFKLQWDSRTLSGEQVSKLVILSDAILVEMRKNKDGQLVELMTIETDLDALWRV
jgi:hypothetical protein